MGNTMASSAQTGKEPEWQSLHAGVNLIGLLLLHFKTDILNTCWWFYSTKQERSRIKTPHRIRAWNYCIQHILKQRLRKGNTEKREQNFWWKIRSCNDPTGDLYLYTQCWMWNIQSTQPELFPMKSGVELRSKPMISKSEQYFMCCKALTLLGGSQKPNLRCMREEEIKKGRLLTYQPH